jgi:hypothetical protein
MESDYGTKSAFIPCNYIMRVNSDGLMLIYGVVDICVCYTCW